MIDEKATNEDLKEAIESISTQFISMQSQLLDSMCTIPILSPNDKLDLALSMMAVIIEPFLRNGALDKVLYTIELVRRKVEVEKCTKPIISLNS